MSLPTYVAFLGGSTSGGTFSGTAPSATKVGDLMVLVLMCRTTGGGVPVVPGWMRAGFMAQPSDTTVAATYVKVAQVAGVTNTYAVGDIASLPAGSGSGVHVWRSTTGGPWALDYVGAADIQQDKFHNVNANATLSKVDDVLLAVTTATGNVLSGFTGETLNWAGGSATLVQVQPAWQSGGTIGGKVTKAHVTSGSTAGTAGLVVYSFEYTFQDCLTCSAFLRIRQMPPGFAGADPGSLVVLYSDGSTVLTSGGSTGASTSQSSGGTGTGSTSSTAQQLGTAAASWLATSDWAEIGFVLLFEGYDLAYCTHSDVSGLQTAWNVATGGRWSVMKGGLELVGTIAQEFRIFNAQINPTSMTFTLLDYDDTLIGTMFADANTSALKVDLLNSIDADDAIIEGVQSMSDFDAGDLLYIGTEEILAVKHTTLDGYGVSTSHFVAPDTGRGVRALHGTYRGGASPNFGQSHKVGGSTEETSSSKPRPVISNVPLHWINRVVGLYLCHKVDGVWSAGLPGSSTNDAELLWTGRIKSYRDTRDGHVELDCIDILDKLKTTLGATAYHGTLGSGLRVTSSEVEFGTFVQTYDAANVPTSYTSTVASFLAEGAVYTHEEVAEALNIVLGSRFIINSGVYGPVGSTLSMLRRQDGKYEIRFTWSGGPATDSAYVDLMLPPRIWRLLGFDVPTDQFLSGTSTNGLLARKHILQFSTSKNHAVVAPRGPLKSVQRPEGGVQNEWSLLVENSNPEFPFIPSAASERIGPNVDGALIINEKFLVLVRQDDTNQFFAYLPPIFFGGERADGETLEKILGDVVDEDSSASLPRIRQAFIYRGTIGEIFLKLLASTGTAGYNHPTYDVFPEGLCAGIPWTLLDWQSILGMGGEYLLLVTKPTPLLTLLESALNFGARNLVFAGGQLRVVNVSSGAQTSTLVRLTEDNKAKQVKQGEARTPILERTTCDRNPDGIINRATLKYNRDLAGDFQKSITVNEIVSQSDTGEVKSISVEAYGIYEDSPLVIGGSTQAWEDNVAAVALSQFAKPLAVAERSYDFSVATRMYPGARVALTDSYMVNPATGTRGVSGLLCWVVSTSFDWSTGVGRCRLVYQPSHPTSIDAGSDSHVAAWGPSAMVDRDYNRGGLATSGFSVDATTVILYKFNELEVAGTGYATAVDEVGSRDLTEIGAATSGLSTNYTHIINGPAGTRYARYFPAAIVNGARLGIATADSGAVTLFQGSWSVECWILPQGVGLTCSLFTFAGPATSETAANNYQAEVQVTSTGGVTVFWEHGNGTDDIMSFAAGTVSVGAAGTVQWQHFQLTVDRSVSPSVIKCYVNGILKGSTTEPDVPTGGTTATLTIGGSNFNTGVSTWKGGMKSLRLSNTVRTAAEAAANAASTTYEHEVDASTFALWQFNEEPDAIEESTYGYHVRKVLGSLTVVDPLIQDGGQARNFASAASEYDGHYDYEPFRAMLAGDFTFEGWCKMDSDYAAADRGWWVYGDPGTDVTATNFFSLNLFGPTGGLYYFMEHGIGVDQNAPMTLPMFTSSTDAQTRHYIAITKRNTGGTAQEIKFYKDAVLIETINVAQGYDGGTSSYLRLSSGSSVSATPFAGSMDDTRWSTGVRTISELNDIQQGGFDCGYNAANKQLRLKKHEYSAETDAIDLAQFQVGDAVHIVQISPTTPTTAAEWSDTIAAIDLDQSIVTLTTGLDGFTCGDYVMEFDDIQDVVTSQRTRSFIADATTRSTGLDDRDAYLWTGEPEVTPDEAFIATKRFRKINSEADDVGTAASVHKLHDLARWAATAAIYHTAPVLVNQPLTQAVSYGSGSTKRMVFGPVWVPIYGVEKRLEVRLLVANTGGAGTVTFKAIVSALMPRANGATDFDSTVYWDVRDNTENWVELTATSATYTWQTGYIETITAYPGSPPGGWFMVEATAGGGAGTASLLHVMLSEAAEGLATADIRQETNFLPASMPLPAVYTAGGQRAAAGGGGGGQRSLYRQAPYTTGMRQRGYT